MSPITDELRRFWLPGINRIKGVPQLTLIGLLGGGGTGYQIYSLISQTSATLHFTDWGTVASAFASDAARAAMAAVESIDSAPTVANLPLAQGWPLIKTYYAGFFAAQSIHRMLGQSITQIDGTLASAIDAIADLFGMAGGVRLQRGLFRLRTDAIAKSITLSKINSEGSHESLWADTVVLLRDLITGILSSPTDPTHAALVAGKLTDVERALTDNGSNTRGSWLSVVRNRVNYHQSFGAWYPYKDRARYCETLLDKMSMWQGEPEAISLWPSPDRELQRFVEACVFLVSLCRSMSLDMNARCPDGRSFHHYTTVNLLGLLKAA